MFIRPPGPATNNNAIRAAAAGIERASARISDRATAVARQTGAAPADLATRAVEILEARAQLQASAKAMTAADRMLGVLIDMRA